MIDATELRIGNYVFLKSKKKNWEILEGYEIDLGCDSDDFEPIPLTEEILLKCGFEKSRNIGCYDTDKDDFFFESDKISLTIDFILSSSNHYYQSTPVDGAIHLKSLHQLQNLVFSVTGQELEINL